MYKNKIFTFFNDLSMFSIGFWSRGRQSQNISMRFRLYQNDAASFGSGSGSATLNKSIPRLGTAKFKLGVFHISPSVQLKTTQT
jgi:hypothetical protein